jgi:hypothetical protein
MKPEIENLKAHMRGVKLSSYQKGLALDEFYKLIDYVTELEKLIQPPLSPGFISVSEQEPPHNTELLAQSPTGDFYLCSWRPAYNIFTCQAKGESSWNWSWKLI